MSDEKEMHYFWRYFMFFRRAQSNNMIEATFEISTAHDNAEVIQFVVSRRLVTLSNFQFVFGRAASQTFIMETFSQVEIPLTNALPSDSGYLIRPFVQLDGLTKGYLWQEGEQGRWIGFLNCKIRNFTAGIKGK